jgi:hypothetical protein
MVNKMKNLEKRFWGLGVVSILALAACTNAATTVNPPEQISESSPTAEEESLPNPAPTQEVISPERDYDIITLLPRDGIPAIDNPVFLSVEEADAEYDADELVMGVVFNGDARAYSVNLLSGHEIVNDTVGGKAISVTW